MDSHTWLIHSLHLARSFSVPKVEKKGQFTTHWLNYKCRGYSLQIKRLVVFFALKKAKIIQIKGEKRDNLLLTGLTTNVEGIYFRLNVL